MLEVSTTIGTSVWLSCISFISPLASFVVSSSMPSIRVKAANCSIPPAFCVSVVITRGLSFPIATSAASFAVVTVLPTPGAPIRSIRGGVVSLLYWDRKVEIGSKVNVFSMAAARARVGLTSEMPTARSVSLFERDRGTP